MRAVGFCQPEPWARANGAASGVPELELQLMS
jgi:hypothetical protein